jgi:sulfur-oxidizing protein SoxX
MRYFTLLTIAAITVLGAACVTGQKSSSGFHLPDGNVEAGSKTFVALRCYDCHQVQGLEMPASELRVPVVLGGKSPFVRTDGELVTLIVDPFYKFGAVSRDDPVLRARLRRMAETGEQVTTGELVDLVAFLHSRYERQPVQVPVY